MSISRVSVEVRGIQVKESYYDAQVDAINEYEREYNNIQQEYKKNKKNNAFKNVSPVFKKKYDNFLLLLCL